MNELKLCPFCGGEAVFHRHERIGIECGECGAGYATVFNTEAEAAEAWNAHAGFTDCDEAYDAGFNGGAKATLVEFEKWVEEQLEEVS